MITGNNFYKLSGIIFVITCILSMLTGQYSLSFSAIIEGDPVATSVFFNLRLARTLMAIFAGFGLSIAGYIYQTVFNNPIAAPDIIGVSSGACAGAAFGIIFLGGSAAAVSTSAFLGGILAVIFAIALASASGERKLSTFVLSGIAINAVAQAILMLLKRTADPFSELASLEFWMMGSLSSVTLDKIYVILPIILVSICMLFLLHRQITMLSLNSDEAKMLGISVSKMRGIVLLLTTLIVGAVVSVTGLITFIGLIAPHITRLITKKHSVKVMFFSGLLGSTILLLADCLARSISESEVPISILTSLLGAPFLIYLVVKGGRL